MAALGDKIAANILAQTAKVPSIPWSGDGLTCQLTEERSDVNDHGPLFEGAAFFWGGVGKGIYVEETFRKDSIFK